MGSHCMSSFVYWRSILSFTLEAYKEFLGEPRLEEQAVVKVQGAQEEQNRLYKDKEPASMKGPWHRIWLQQSSGTSSCLEC